MSKILIYDIENMGLRGWSWGLYEQNVLHVDHYEHLLCFAWKWLGDKKVQVLGLDDFKDYKKDPHNDLPLVKKLHELFSEADIIVAHNGDQFDQKMVQARMMTHHLAPPEPYKQIDTKKVAKRYARFSSNKLDDLGKQLGLGQKLKTGGFDLWIDCDEGDPKAWKKMKAYNKTDVALLEQLYLELRPWIHNHPSVSLIDGEVDGCPKCGAQEMQKRGFLYTTVGKKQRYQCQNPLCMGWATGRLTVKTGVHYV